MTFAYYHVRCFSVTKLQTDTQTTCYKYQIISNQIIYFVSCIVLIIMYQNYVEKLLDK